MTLEISKADWILTSKDGRPTEEIVVNHLIHTESNEPLDSDVPESLLEAIFKVVLEETYTRTQ